MKFIFAILFVLLISFVPVFLQAQSNQINHEINIGIPEVALLGLVSEDENHVTLNVSAPGEAGSSIDFSMVRPDNRIWINYSSVILNREHRRKINAVVYGEIPAGVRLFVEASQATGHGKGKLGKPAGRVALSDQPAEVISDIGSCYTGKGISTGHLLTYILEADDSDSGVTSLAQHQASLQVVYTLTDHH